MILAENYTTDIGYMFSLSLVSLIFTSDKSLSLSELIDNDFLPIELNNQFIEGDKLFYCKHKRINFRQLHIETPDNFIFIITCSVPFKDIDFTTMLNNGFKIGTKGENIKEDLLKLLLDKNYG